LSKQQDVEFLPHDPSVNRIKGDGATSIFDWAWRKFGLGLVLLVAFLSPGVILLRNGYRDFRVAKNFK
jgi:hypothetical protein